MITMLLQATPATSDVLSIIRDVHGFYNDAWSSLLWTVGLEGGALALLLGVVLPWWTERSRRESFKLEKDALFKQISEAREEARRQINEATDLYKQNLKEVLKQVADNEKEARMREEDLACDMWLGEGFDASDSGNHAIAIDSMTIAIAHWAKGHKSKQEMALPLRLLDNMSSDPAKSDLFVSDSQRVKALSMSLALLENQGLEGDDLAHLQSIKQFVAKIPAADTKSTS